MCRADGSVYASHNPTNMKKKLILAGCIFAVLLAGWLIGNLRYCRFGPEEQAVTEIAKKYGITKVARVSLSESKFGIPGRLRSWTVSDDAGKTVAQVTINSFIGLGWLEHTYEAR